MTKKFQKNKKGNNKKILIKNTEKISNEKSKGENMKKTSEKIKEKLGEKYREQ